MFARRGPLGKRGALEWRVRLAGAGILLALVGIYFDAGWVIWLAIAALAAGFLFRFFPQGRGPDEASPDDDELEG